MYIMKPHVPNLSPISHEDILKQEINALNNLIPLCNEEIAIHKAHLHIQKRRVRKLQKVRDSDLIKKKYLKSTLRPEDLALYHKLFDVMLADDTSIIDRLQETYVSNQSLTKVGLWRNKNMQSILHVTS